MLGHLADSSFNYNVAGPAGFRTLADVVGASECGKLTYSDLDDVVPLLTGKADRAAAGEAVAPVFDSR
jgi:hypothetical protein